MAKLAMDIGLAIGRRGLEHGGDLGGQGGGLVRLQHAWQDDAAIGLQRRRRLRRRLTPRLQIAISPGDHGLRPRRRRAGPIRPALEAVRF